MITESFRPSTWESLKGQSLVKSLLIPIVRNPESSPRTLIFEGSFGTGKTSTARILARSLNCKSGHNGIPCGSCSMCQADLRNSMFYVEYDSSMMGTVDQIRQIRDSLTYNVGSFQRVIVFDEAHLLSRQAQNALLKEIEDVRNGIFFVFCTTEIGDLIPTIRSRSLEVRFESIRPEDVRESLLEISSGMDISVPDSVIELIVTRASGHMRDAHKLLNQYMVVGEDTFMRVYFNTEIIWLHLMYAMVSNNEEKFIQLLSKLGDFPLMYLKQDYERFVGNFLHRFVTKKLQDGERAILAGLKQNSLSFFKTLLSSFILESFDSDFRLRAAFLLLLEQTRGVS